MSAFIDLTGGVYGRLTVECLEGTYPKKGAKWWCTCECGELVVVASNHLRTGHTSSCGCLVTDTVTARNLKHGLAGNTPLYKTWSHMKQRCHNKDNASYRWYGAKGVSVCSAWKDNFEAFYSWAVTHGYKEGLTIDRKRSTGNYCPSNCRFLTRSENSKRLRHLKNITNTSGYCGVSRDNRSGKWSAGINTGNGWKHLGTFKTKREAIAARKAAERGLISGGN